MRRALVVLLLMASPALALDPPPRGYERTESDDLIVDRRAVDDALARSAIAHFREARAAIEERLGARTDPLPRLILAPTDEEFDRFHAELSGGTKPTPWIAGVAFPARNTVLIRASRVGRGEIFFDLVFRHELAHLALHRVERVAGGAVPRWLSEGLADHAAGVGLSRDEERDLARAARFDDLERLDDLASAFPPHEARTARAYRASLSFVQFLDAHAKPEGARGIVYLLDRRTSPAEAVYRLTGLKLPEAEAEWRRGLAARYSIAEALLHSSEVWWGLVALLAVVAMGRSVLERRRLRKKLETEDE